MTTDRMLAEASALEPVYLDGCSVALNLGSNANLVFFRYVPVLVDGVITLERSPMLSVIMPWSSAFCKSPQTFFAAALQERPPIEPARLPRFDCH
jgi:hypothetical protein